MVGIAGAIGVRLGGFLASRIGQTLFGSKLRTAATIGVGVIGGKMLTSGGQVSQYRS